jgi:hypothetical protein
MGSFLLSCFLSLALLHCFADPTATFDDILFTHNNEGELSGNQKTYQLQLNPAEANHQYLSIVGISTQDVNVYFRKSRTPTKTAYDLKSDG